MLVALSGSSTKAQQFSTDELVYLGMVATWHDMGTAIIREADLIVGAEQSRFANISGVRTRAVHLLMLTDDMGPLFFIHKSGIYDTAFQALFIAIGEAGHSLAAFADWLEQADTAHLTRYEELWNSSQSYFERFYDSLPISLPDRRSLMV